MKIFDNRNQPKKSRFADLAPGTAFTFDFLQGNLQGNLYIKLEKPFPDVINGIPRLWNAVYFPKGFYATVEGSQEVDVVDLSVTIHEEGTL